MQESLKKVKFRTALCKDKNPHLLAKYAYNFFVGASHFRVQNAREAFGFACRQHLRLGLLDFGPAFGHYDVLP